MVDESDRSAYIRLVFRYWPLVLGLAFAGMVLAGLLSWFVLTPAYSATATVVTTAPRYQLGFAAGMDYSSDTKVPAKAYAGLAKNGELMSRVLNTVKATVPLGLSSPEALADLCSVSATADPTVIRLSVQHRKPVLAAEIANTWARLYVQQMGEIYGLAGSDLVALQQQEQSAQQALVLAEQALAEFESRDSTAVLSRTIEADLTVLSSYAVEEENLRALMADASRLRTQMAGSDVTAVQENKFALQASELLEFAASWILLGSQQAYLPDVEVSLQDVPTSSLDRAATIQSLDRVKDALGAKAEATAASRAEISARVLSAQAIRQQAVNELNALQRDTDLAGQAYKIVALQVKELTIASQLDTGEVRVASEATVPTRPISPKKLANVVIGGGLGTVLGLIVALWREYMRPLLGPARRAE